MALPENIAVRYTEDEAEYVSLRPVVRQTFRIAELVDMVLSVTGKDAPRICQILRSGAVAYHGYRYWWGGFEASEADLLALLAAYPEADSSRPFVPTDCAAVVLESDGTPSRHSVEISRAAAGCRWFRFRSFWGDLMQAAQSRPPIYSEYSYSRRADIYIRELSSQQSAELMSAARRLLPHRFHTQLNSLQRVARILLICPRPR